MNFSNDRRSNRHSWFSSNQNGYDFYNAENIHRTNSFKNDGNSKPDVKLRINSKQQEDTFDTVSEISFRQNRFRNIDIFRFARNKTNLKQRSNSISLNQTNLRKPDVVFLYHSLTKGLVGSLTIDSEKIIFTGFIHDLKTSKHNFLKMPSPNNPLRQESIESSLKNGKYEVDLINIAEISKEQNDIDPSIVFIHCRNFKHVKFGMNQASADALYNRLIIDHQTIFKSPENMRRSFLWEYLHNTYRYNLKSDWIKHEKWYVNNFKIQFSQFNEEITSCITLPDVVIVPRGVDDQELQSIVNISDGFRIPIVTYLFRQSGHMVLRTTTFNTNNLKLHDLYKKKIFSDGKIPLVEYEVQQRLPTIDEILKNHSKLRKACFKVIKNFQSNSIDSLYEINQSKKFQIKCAPWLQTISDLLKLTIEMVNILQRKSSIGLIEKFDRNWNCVLSSLIQIFVDPEKRTMKGFESLLSKEWLYLSGYKQWKTRYGEKRIKNIVDPDSILFLLFIDSVHQLIIQNPKSFEFSTFFLIYLIDYQVETSTRTKDLDLEYQTGKEHPLMLNPLFDTIRI